MTDYFFKIFTFLRNCNVASSPALILGGASEQLSSLCLDNFIGPRTNHDCDERAHSGEFVISYPRTQIFFGQNMKIHVYLGPVAIRMCWFFCCLTPEKNSKVGVSELRDRGSGSGQHTCWAPAPQVWQVAKFWPICQKLQVMPHPDTKQSDLQTRPPSASDRPLKWHGWFYDFCQLIS